MSMTEIDTDLSELADEANAAHAAAQKSFACGVEHARRAGEALNKAKAAVGYGEWGRWLADHFHGATRTAQVYMRLARVLPQVDDETRNAVADLSLREAIRALSESRQENSETEQSQVISVHVRDSEPVVTKVRINVQESHDVAGSTAPSRTYLPESPRTEAATDNVVYPPFFAKATDPAAEQRNASGHVGQGDASGAPSIPATLDALCRSHSAVSVAQELASSDQLSFEDLDRLARWFTDTGAELRRLTQTS